MGKRNERRPSYWERRKERLLQKDKETLVERLFYEEKNTSFWFEESKHYKDALKQMKRELDRANHQLHVYGVHGNYIAMADRLEHTLIDLRGAKADLKILEEALADKNAGKPNWENVAELKMRKARY